MLGHNILTLALLASLVQAVTSSVVRPSRRQSSLDSFIQSESTIALQGVLNNIGANGSSVAGASSGVVVASPSKSNPDCVCSFFIFLFFILVQTTITRHQTN